jgi:hypothetical protein
VNLTDGLRPECAEAQSHAHYQHEHCRENLEIVFVLHTFFIVFILRKAPQGVSLQGYSDVP